MHVCDPVTHLFQVWYAVVTWLVEFVILKAVLYMLGIASFVPWLELVAYSGVCGQATYVCLLLHHTTPPQSCQINTHVPCGRVHVHIPQCHFASRCNWGLECILCPVGLLLNLHSCVPCAHHEAHHIP